jgi:uncharacterized protein
MVGLIGTVSGGGGGALAVPVVVATFSGPVSALVGSIFVMYLVGSISAFIVYSRKGLVDYRNGILLAIPSIPGVILGTLIETSFSNFEFKIGLGLVTIVSAVGLLARGEMRNTEVDSRNLANTEERSTVVDKSGRTFTYAPRLRFGFVANFFAGLLSGIFGAGAALIVVPLTILLVRIPSHVAIATTRIVLLVLNASAVLTHIGINAVNYSYAIILSIGAVAGTLLGARIAFKMSPSFLTKIIAIILVVIGAYLMISSF